MSLNEALTQNTEYREKLNRIRRIANPEGDIKEFDDERDSDSHTLPIIEVCNLIRRIQKIATRGITVYTFRKLKNGTIHTTVFQLT